MLNSTTKDEKINPFEAEANPEVNRKNILAIHQYALNSRDIIRELEVRVDQYKKDNEMLSSRVDLLESQIKHIQVQLFRGATTSGN